ncbi:hypothetical protein [Polystyrenella longa]|uniref:hypothetical protein n=1 Tax=Polystyrenella longa TaxID=2528007 RepID=UPI0011A23BDE|nr:hypothetical protein [Polystyrenella longa]
MGLFASTQLHAHPISLTNAYIRVFPDKVSAKIEIFVEDLYLFHDLKPNDQDLLEPDTLRKGIELHKEFLAKHFQILDKDGNQLKGTVVDVREFDIPEEGLPLASLMFFQLTYTLEYDVDKPEYLTFLQDMGNQDIGVPAETQLRVLQEGAKRRKEKLMLPGEPFTLRFNWENPEMTDSSFNAGETTEGEEGDSDEEELLGITSYGAVYSFLYIEPREIRHEILIPVVTLEQSVEIPRADSAFLTIKEQPKAREAIEKFLKSKNKVEVNGQLIEPEIDRIDFYGLDFRDFAQQAPDQNVSMANGRVGVIISYPLNQPPEEVKMTWDFFNRYLWDVKGTVYVNDKTIKTELSRLNEENTYTWVSESVVEPYREIEPYDVTLPKPVAYPVSIPALLCLGIAVVTLFVGRKYTLPGILVAVALGLAFLPIARIDAATWIAPPARLSEEESKTLFEELLGNVYYAMENRQEERIYDGLEHAVAGEMLSDLYLKMKKELVIEEQGGPVARVTDIKIQAMEIGKPAQEPTAKKVDPRAFTVDCTWQVVGTVEHWGHIHSRTIEYQALFVVSPVEGKWKITALTVESENRIKYETRLRGI